MVYWNVRQLPGMACILVQKFRDMALVQEFRTVYWNVRYL